MDFLTIIIPVYKTDESYLRRCIESLTAQKNQEFKAVLIDDGSPDECGKICDEYAQQDKRLTVIHQENGGAAVARNSGLRTVNTEWIAFVDPDDWVDSNLVDALYEVTHKYQADVYYYDYFHELGNESVEKQLNAPEGLLDEKWQKQLKLALFNNFWMDGRVIEYETNTLWNKMFRAEIIKNNGILFEPRARKGQDVIFVAEALQYANRLCYMKKTLYHYRFLDTSITNRYNPKSVFYNEVAFECQKRIINECSLGEEYKGALSARICTRMYSAMRLYYFNEKNPNSYKDTCKEINEKLDSEPYKSAFDTVKYKDLSLQQKLFVFLLKRRMLFVIRWLVKVRTSLRKTG
ncbi:MAG: glycosyltransferase [Tannerellaceae bacterium]|nr:glycosyltransferase [Tannerellaceae bacterium]